MHLSRFQRRFLIGGGVLGCGLLVTILLARVAFTGFALGFLLKHAGASETNFHVTRASPWFVVVDDVAFLLQGQGFSARQVSFERPHWWTSSLGHVRVEQVKVPVVLDRPKTAVPASATNVPPAAIKLPENIPFDELSVDGQIVLQATGAPDHVLTLKLEAKQAMDETWQAQVQIDGGGLGLTATGTYDPAAQRVDFGAPAIVVDGKALMDFIQRVVPLPELDGWDFAGQVQGQASGRWAGGKWDATGGLQLRSGRISNSVKAITADNVELDLEFTDVMKLQTKPGSLRVRELTVKEFPMRDGRAEFSLNGIDHFAVSHLALATLGGTVTTEPFQYSPSSDKLNAVVVVDGISVEEVMAMTKDLPAKAKGRVNGRFPISLDEDGFHFGTGWLELKPGVNAEVAFSASGLLTAGTSPKSPSYGVLQRIESGLLTLGISELRLDIQPPNAPPGRSATLHLAGAPLDQTVKAPVILDLNVNGPLEKLLKLGLDSRLKVGTKP